MPYNANIDLPSAAKDTLPEHAQSIFRRAFNASYKKYGEERAFKIAWSAVKKAGYKKGTGDKWVKESVTVSLIATGSQWPHQAPESSGIIIYRGSADKSDLTLSEIQDMEFDDPNLILANVTESINSYYIEAIQVNSRLELPISLDRTLSKVI